ncbi:MAG: putative DNA binding domain-containing protein [Clostridiales bacterium]|nr:putative DNA binding domain-containing protein [Clostridiales bacterium]
MRMQETNQIELKEMFVPELKKDVVAFANTDGGVIYIGISDDGEFIGVEDHDQAMQQVTNAIRDGVRPDVTIFTQCSFVHDAEKTAIKLMIMRGTKQPYYLSDKGMRPKGVYIRQGTSSVPASEDAIRKMIRESESDSYEANRSLLQDLTFDYAKAELASRKIEFGKVQQKNIGVLTSDAIYTNLGLLLSDQCKHTTKLAIFQGTDKLVFKDRKEFTGSLFKQLEDAYSAVEFYNATRATFKGLTRSDERDYPPDAVREALLNAIVHRDYSFSGSTFINLYADRIEFVSLGGLISGLSIDAIMMGASQSRNEKLAALFYRMRLIEAYGTGIGKIMSSYSGYARKPVFENADGAFRVILPNCHYMAENDTQIAETKPRTIESILEYMHQHGSATRKDLEQHIGLGTTRTIMLLKEMLTNKMIVKIGNGKKTRYLLK